MKKRQPSPSPDAWAVILERGYSEPFIAKIEKLEVLKFWNPSLNRWLASDSDLGIITAPQRKGFINVRTAYIATRRISGRDKSDHRLLCRLHRQRQAHRMGTGRHSVR